MTDNTNPAPAAESLRAEVAGDYTVPDYSIAPEDEGLASEIIARTPDALPGPHKIRGAIKIGPLKATTLPPEAQSAVAAKLARLPVGERAGAESEMTAKVLRDNAAQFRMSTGLDPLALPYHHEELAVAREWQNHAREVSLNADRLAKVESYGVETDPETGKQRPKESLLLRGEVRRQLEARQQELLRAMRLLVGEDGTYGPEGKRRMQAALAESVEVEKARRAAAEEEAESDVRAAQLLREERIEKRAQAKAKHLRNSI